MRIHFHIKSDPKISAGLITYDLREFCANAVITGTQLLLELIFIKIPHFFYAMS